PRACTASIPTRTATRCPRTTSRSSRPPTSRRARARASPSTAGCSGRRATSDERRARAMKTLRALVMSGSLALGLWSSPTIAQAPTTGCPNVLAALRATPGCLGVETGQTAGGRQVIFAWFENKKALVDWYHSEAHQKAMKTVFPNQTFDRQPLPDLAEDSGPILTIVSVQFVDTPRPDATSRPMSSTIASIGIELYGPLPGGVAGRRGFRPRGLEGL